jgi:hypothetical protein
MRDGPKIHNPEVEYVYIHLYTYTLPFPLSEKSGLISTTSKLSVSFSMLYLHKWKITPKGEEGVLPWISELHVLIFLSHVEFWTVVNCFSFSYPGILPCILTSSSNILAIPSLKL